MAVRNPYFDFLRGAAIIMVVGIHTFNVSSVGFNTIQEMCTVILRMILNCAVPLFLAISGFFIGGRDYTWGKEHLRFLKRQIPKIYIPCLIFSVPELAFAIYTGRNGMLHNLGYYFFCGFSIYYFIALIIQYYILLPVFTKFNKLRGVILAGLVSGVSIIILTYITKYLGIQLPLIISAGPFYVWIVFFLLGMYLSKHNRDYSLFWPIFIIVIGLAFQVIEYLFWYQYGINAIGIKISSFIYSFGIIMVLFSKKTESIYKGNLIFSVINWVGGISFGIYLIHCYIILIGSKLLLNRIELSWIASWIFYLSVTVLVIWGIRSIVPNISKKYLGFR